MRVHHRYMTSALHLCHFVPGRPLSRCLSTLLSKASLRSERLPHIKTSSHALSSTPFRRVHATDPVEKRPSRGALVDPSKIESSAEPFVAEWEDSSDSSEDGKGIVRTVSSNFTYLKFRSRNPKYCGKPFQPAGIGKLWESNFRVASNRSIRKFTWSFSNSRPIRWHDASNASRSGHCVCR